MKKPNYIFSSLLAASMLTLGFTGVAYAYGGPAGSGGPGYDGAHCDHQRGFNSAPRNERMTQMMNRLELNQQQREAISNIKNEQDRKMQARMDEIKKVRNAMRAQSMTEKYDAAKVRELADTQAKLMSDMMVERMETMHLIRKQMTEQQAARMEAMRTQMQQRRSANDNW